MSDVKWMTYAELAEALGIGGDSARNLVRRKRWGRQAGNDGLARVGVPVEYLAEHAPITSPIDAPAEPPVDAPIDGGIIPILNRHIERLEIEIEKLKTERDAERTIAAQVGALNAVLEIERERAAELRAERDRLLDRLMAPPPVRRWWPFRKVVG